MKTLTLLSNLEKSMEVLTVPESNNLTGLVGSLNTQLTNLRPNNSEITQVITYALLATAVVGLMVYHYIKEAND